MYIPFTGIHVSTCISTMYMYMCMYAATASVCTIAVEIFTDTYTYTHSLSLSLSLSHTHTHTLSLSFSLSLSHTHTQCSPRSDSIQCFVRVEHGNTVLGDGDKCACEKGGVMSGGVEVKLECNSTQRHSIDKLIQSPIIGM